MALYRNIAGFSVGTGETADCGCNSNNELLLGGAAITLGYLVANAGRVRTIGAKKRKFLVPALVIGGLAAAWYFMSGTASPAAPEADSQETATQRANLLNYYSAQPKASAVVAGADAETLRRWFLLVSEYWAVPGSNPYLVDVNNQPTLNWDGSLGKWWENFKSQNGI